MPTAGGDLALASPLHSTPALTSLDEAQLDTVTGGGVVGPVAKVVGKWWGPVDVLTSGYDAYSAYSSARAANKSVPVSVGDGAKMFVRSLSMYDLWKNYCGTAY